MPITARRNLQRRKLNNLLELAPDQQFFTMCWATNAIQSGRTLEARQIFDFPLEAATDDTRSPWRMHPWALETLLNEVLTIPKSKRMLSGQRLLNCSTFGAMRKVYNALHELEDAEDGMALQRVNVVREMHRLAQRQIEWQRGFWTAADLYRSAFIYGGELTLDYFLKSKGFSLHQLSHACTLFLGMYWKSPSISVNGDAPILSKEVLLAVLDGISLPLETARKRAKALRDRPIHTSYKPSLLREYPCIRFASRFVAPLPDLVAIRSTTGVFYDIVAGPLGVRAEIGKRFEAYCLTLLQLSLPEIEIVGEYNYHIRKGFSFATPDILLRRCKKLSVIFECKATRMSYEAKFSEDPMTDAERSYKEVAKGVFQIWRFVSHVRQGLMPSEICCENVKGVLLTLDTWLTAANHMQQEVLRLARVMASGSEHDILECDQIGIVFCPIVELELTLQQATACSFLKALAAATDLPHEGWFLSSVHQRVSPSLERNDYPFLSRMGEVLPWWNMEPD